jgi:hypothetical protein
MHTPAHPNAQPLFPKLGCDHDAQIAQLEEHYCYNMITITMPAHHIPLQGTRVVEAPMQGCALCIAIVNLLMRSGFGHRMNMHTNTLILLPHHLLLRSILDFVTKTGFSLLHVALRESNPSKISLGSVFHSKNA